MPALINNCDEEQYAQLVPKVMSCAILSAYAQTELGHGTLDQFSCFPALATELHSEEH